MSLALVSPVRFSRNRRRATARHRAFRCERITGLKGTAVNVQAMVFGNTGDTSGSGVVFTRNPANGTDEFYGEFLINAQGEDVVAGIRTPQPVAEMPKWNKAIHKQLLEIKKILIEWCCTINDRCLHTAVRRRFTHQLPAF